MKIEYCRSRHGDCLFAFFLLALVILGCILSYLGATGGFFGIKANYIMTEDVLYWIINDLERTMSNNYVEKTAILYALLPVLYFFSGYLNGKEQYVASGILIMILAVAEYIGIKLWYKTLVEGLKK